MNNSDQPTNIANVGLHTYNIRQGGVYQVTVAQQHTSTAERQKHCRMAFIYLLFTRFIHF